jgi:hypothetical protein
LLSEGGRQAGMGRGRRRCTTSGLQLFLRSTTTHQSILTVSRRWYIQYLCSNTRSRPLSASVSVMLLMELESGQSHQLTLDHGTTSVTTKAFLSPSPSLNPHHPSQHLHYSSFCESNLAPNIHSKADREGRLQTGEHVVAVVMPHARGMNLLIRTAML